MDRNQLQRQRIESLLSISRSEQVKITETIVIGELNGIAVDTLQSKLATLEAEIARLEAELKMLDG
jgi:uncharacterized small protein (DUF1192 family)